MSLDVNIICFSISFGFIEKTEFTPVVFLCCYSGNCCHSITSNAVTVFISACIPAPPEESDPAMIKIFDFGFKLIY